ncbi:MAG: hypothetical protein LBH79_00330 [Nitrososphaerota archaeon]|nr:hypothetical protein [Nitrososphaerota archaeon]
MVDFSLGVVLGAVIAELSIEFVYKGRIQYAKTCVFVSSSVANLFYGWFVCFFRRKLHTYPELNL